MAPSEIERRIQEVISKGHVDQPYDIAAVLVDEDVSQGMYEGCSSELEGWFTEYQNHAERILSAQSVR